MTEAMLAQPTLQLHPSWQACLGDEFLQPYMQDLKKFLLAEQKAGKTIYPVNDHWFNAFNTTPFDQVKVVILGQDPYHGPGQAHGLCFSVQPDIAMPPSLLNIFKEINRDLAIPVPADGYLQRWAEQGVLMLNATLTVERGQAGSHQGRGWEQFTDRVIGLLNERRQGLVFMLWGNYAQKKGRLIDGDKHLVLKAPHPSPLSAYRGFIGCGHFSEVNRYLQQQGKAIIDW